MSWHSRSAALAIVLALPVTAAAQSISSTQFNQNDNTGATTGTIAAVNVTSGEALVVVAINRQNTAQTASSATHGASALTSLVANSAGDGINVNVWCTLGLSGSQTVTVTFSATTLWHLYAFRVASPNVTTPCGTPSLASGGSGATTVSASVSTASASDLVLAVVLPRNLVAASLTVIAGQTQLSENSGASYASAASTEPGTGASVTSGWTWTGAIENRIVVLNLPAVAGGGGSTPRTLTLVGVGP